MRIYAKPLTVIREFRFKCNYGIKLRKVSFYQAAEIYHGKPDWVNQTIEVVKSTFDPHTWIAPLLGPVTALETRNGAYLDVLYSGHDLKSRFYENGDLVEVHRANGAVKPEDVILVFN
ncbi:unnamed protein product [Caenorhabditis bovis]|uniref:Uncharacterized protein n=1 Tax=Caenorhabditis bovis TaxID=2654633 RepID=A0A8S1E0U9_9PELO|nr:unnamed protein product [Caenorhabditis bovis]